jgi:hypothetical protein
MPEWFADDAFWTDGRAERAFGYFEDPQNAKGMK